MATAGFRRVVFVCTGNTCRSPMAHYYCQHRVAELGLDLEVGSGGMTPGTGVAANTVAVLRETGVDVEREGGAGQHQAHAVPEGSAAEGVLLLCMTHRHRDLVLERIPSVDPQRVILLSTFLSGEAVDIPDPVGRPLDVYQDVFKSSIQPAVDGLLRKVRTQ
eukprot:Hpha_TRINITY_DN15939_c0_g2::TRINITY_DN15939_c0_g2_i1::g.71651::m.71651/K01104/E3.1.3.48; protein-tyrosine phosphatase